MAHVALLFGSFNPVHKGHLALAQYALAKQKVEEVWLVISPQNPLKNSENLLPIDLRMNLLELAVQSMDTKNIAVCGIETELPAPHYTYKTLSVLKGRYPEHQFAPLVGTDILYELDRWKEVDIITQEFGWYVYPRPGYPVPSTHAAESNMQLWEDAPLSDLSSSQIRQDWCEGKSIENTMSEKVFERWKELVSTKLTLLSTEEDWYEEGVRQRKWGHLGEAANCFDKAVTINPSYQKAKVAIEMLESIQVFYHSDIYNP